MAFFVSIEMLIGMFCLKAFFCLKMPVGIVTQKLHALFDHLLSLAIQYRVIQAMACFEETFVLFIDCPYAERVVVRPGFQHNVRPVTGMN
jgi:hypothetical protein